MVVVMLAATTVAGSRQRLGRSLLVRVHHWWREDSAVDSLTPQMRLVVGIGGERGSVSREEVCTEVGVACFWQGWVRWHGVRGARRMIDCPRCDCPRCHFQVPTWGRAGPSCCCNDARSKQCNRPDSPLGRCGSNLFTIHQVGNQC